MDGESNEETKGQISGLFQRLIHDIWTSPVNLILVILIIVLLVKLFLLKRKPTSSSTQTKARPQLPKMAKQDLTIAELRAYDGKESNGRILTAIYGDIFDVSRRSDLYGQGNCGKKLN
jgi:membrane-associated progesterone receptor component